MSAAHQQKRYYTPEEYLALERASEFKSEYISGEIRSTASINAEHDTITINLLGLVYTQLRDGPCRLFTSQMKVRSRGMFAYPDLTVVCGQHHYHDENVTS